MTFRNFRSLMKVCFLPIRDVQWKFKKKKNQLNNGIFGCVIVKRNSINSVPSEYNPSVKSCLFLGEYYSKSERFTFSMDFDTFNVTMCRICSQFCLDLDLECQECDGVVEFGMNSNRMANIFIKYLNFKHPFLYSISSKFGLTSENIIMRNLIKYHPFRMSNVYWIRYFT